MLCCFQITSGRGILSPRSSTSSSSMAANPFLVRAESRSMATSSDLSLDRSLFSASDSSSSHRRELVFVVNPRGANGRTGKQWKKLLPYLRSRLDKDCKICESLTSGPYHAIDITRERLMLAFGNSVKGHKRRCGCCYCSWRGRYFARGATSFPCNIHFSVTQPLLYLCCLSTFAISRWSTVSFGLGNLLPIMKETLHAQQPLASFPWVLVQISPELWAGKKLVVLHFVAVFC
ncbi:unnamed protein product [Linum tenue]|uniref:DAGKc domain-containing protein n=1 Tax=Linum tenue TaxID=586396 RepID=A0AAV0PHD1_9ROSI|nr:unnamed protein product [Linum tenue]